MKVKVDTLQNWEQNPREIDEKNFRALVKYVSKYPETIHLIVDGRDKSTVLGGNMRLRAIRSLGWEEVEVAFVNVKNDAEAVEVALIDNNQFGTYVKGELLSLVGSFDDLALDDFNVDFNPRSLKDIVSREFHAAEDDFDPSSVEENKHGVVQGDVWQLGRHRLVCGDATVYEDVLKLMEGGKASMVFTDPPYNVDYKGSAGKIMNDNLGSNFSQFLIDAIANMRAFVEGDVYIAMSSSELHTLYNAFSVNDGHWSTYIIWVKNTFTMGRSNYQRQYEPILYGWFEKSSHYWSGARNLSDVLRLEDARRNEDGTVVIAIDNVPMDVWEFPKPTKSKEHPTMKPVKLCERAVANSSRMDDTVLDLFGGSGSTLIACEQMQRSCRILELDPHYCSVIIERWQTLTNQKAKRL